MYFHPSCCSQLRSRPISVPGTTLGIESDDADVRQLLRQMADVHEDEQLGGAIAASPRSTTEATCSCERDRIGQHERVLPRRAADAHQAEGVRIVHLARRHDDATARPQQSLQALNDQEMGEKIDGKGELETVGRGRVAGDHLDASVECQRIDRAGPEQARDLVARRVDRVRDWRDRHRRRRAARRHPGRAFNSSTRGDGPRQQDDVPARRCSSSSRCSARRPMPLVPPVITRRFRVDARRASSANAAGGIAISHACSAAVGVPRFGAQIGSRHPLVRGYHAKRCGVMSVRRARGGQADGWEERKVVELGSGR